MKIKLFNKVIIPYDVWFLEGIKDFCERKLFLGKTKKNTIVTCLVEKRMYDGKIFEDVQIGENAKQVIEKEKKRVLYTRQEAIMSRKGKPYSWTYGDNKEIHNSKGKIIAIKQKRCDYFGNSEIVAIVDTEQRNGLT